MIINDRGLNGSIVKDSQGYNVNVSYKGWGSMELYQVLEKLNLISKLENMNPGESIVFRDRFVLR